MSSQWLDADEAEEEAAVEEEDEVGAARGDDHHAVNFLAATPLFVQKKDFVTFNGFFCSISFFLILYIKIPVRIK